MTKAHTPTEMSKVWFNVKCTVTWKTHNLLCKSNFFCREKRRRSDPVLWENPLYQQKIRKPKDNTQTQPKTSITQRLRTDLGRSVGRTRQIIRYPATATLRRQQNKQYSASNRGVGVQTQQEHHTILTKYEAVHPTAVSENNSSSGMLII